MMWGVGFANDVCLSPVLWTLDRKKKNLYLLLCIVPTIQYRNTKLLVVTKLVRY
jgi:hypothetical protein